MSMDVLTLVWKKAPYEGNTLLALLALADWSSDEGVSWPSVQKIATKSRQSERNCQYAISKMKREGFLSVKHRKDNSSLYTINIKKLESMGAIFAPLDIEGVQRESQGVQNTAEKMSLIAPNTSNNHHVTHTSNNTSLLFDSKPEKIQNLEASHVEEVFKYYLSRLGRKPAMYTLTPLRMKKGIHRFRECMDITRESSSAVALMKLCVDKLAASDFHREGGYIEWDTHLFGSTEKLQMWMNRETRNGHSDPPLEDALARERRKDAERRSR